MYITIIFVDNNIGYIWSYFVMSRNCSILKEAEENNQILTILNVQEIITIGMIKPWREKISRTMMVREAKYSRKLSRKDLTYNNLSLQLDFICMIFDKFNSLSLLIIIVFKSFLFFLHTLFILQKFY